MMIDQQLPKIEKFPTFKIHYINSKSRYNISPIKKEKKEKEYAF